VSGADLPGSPVSFDIGAFCSPVDGDEDMNFPFPGAPLSNIDVQVSARVALKVAPGFVAFTVWQTADAVTLQAVVQGRAGQFREARLQGQQAIVQRQQGVAAKGDDRDLFFDGKHRWTYLLRPHRGIFDGIPPPPLGNGFDVDLQFPVDVLTQPQNTVIRLNA